MEAQAFKQQAHELIDRLPDDLSCEEAIERLETWLDIVASEADHDAGRVVSNEDIRARYGLEP